MGDDPQKKHEGLIEPGSKEHEEISKAFHKVFDTWSKQGKEWSMSPEMNSYLMDLSELRVRDETLKELWTRNLVAVHPPEAHGDPADRWTHQQKQQRWAREALLALSKHGGYVWIESPDSKGVKVGRVEPNTEPENLDAVLTDPPFLGSGTTWRRSLRPWRSRTSGSWPRTRPWTFARRGDRAGLSIGGPSAAPGWRP